MAGFYLFNGKFISVDSSVLSADNRSYRYGDGLFETIRIRLNHAPLWDWHMDRLFSSLHKLQFILPAHLDKDVLHQYVNQLLKKNNLTDARVRISFFRGNGGLTDPIPESFGYLIQAWPIHPETLGFNSNGLHVGTYTEAQKSTDFLANLKSNNYLPYVMASLYAKHQKWNDALVINHHGRIADSCIANVFWIKNGNIFTTPISEGPVNGVMRRYLATHLPITEMPISSTDLLDADEIFLTNAVKGIQWVGMFEERRMPPPSQSMKLYQQFIQPLFG